MGKTELQLYGAGGHGKVVAEAWQLTGGTIARVVDDDLSVVDFDGRPVLRPSNLEVTLEVFVAIGSNELRRKVVGKLKSFSFAKVIHGGAIVSPTARIGGGTLVMPGVIINSGVIVGMHCIINSGAIVEHDSHIADFVHVAPGVVICGGTTVGEGTLIGANACIIPGVKVGRDCVVGAGCVVLKDLPDNLVAVGNPARVVRKV